MPAVNEPHFFMADHHFKKPIWARGLPLPQQILFARRLALLQQSGMPLLRSLRILARQAQDKRTRQIFNFLATTVEQGQPLSAGLNAYPWMFTQFFVHIVYMGERAGTLQKNLIMLAEALSSRLQLQRKIRAACLYPGLISLLTLGIALALTLFLFPKIIPIFAGLEFSLPLTTRWLIMISSFIIEYWIALIVFIGAGAALGPLVFRYERVKQLGYKILFVLPVVGGLAKEYCIGQACRALGVLLASDLSLTNALQISAKITESPQYRQAMTSIAQWVTHGQRISTYMLTYPALFPPTVTQMVEVAEQSGTLANTFLFLADYYDQEIEERTKNLSTVLEPLLMVGMGLVVGFVAVSIISPIYGFTQRLTP